MTGQSLIGLQRRMMRLGKVRLGEKGPKGEPRKLQTFRFTSASRQLLEAVAARWGGTVSEWAGAPEEGYFQVTTDATELPIILPPVFSDADGSPTLPYSQYYELWSAGGCQRRCDGSTESLSGKPCLCDPHARECKITTRLNFMLPDIPGLGVWNLESHGWNAAAELPGTLDVLNHFTAQGQMLDAVLRAEERKRVVEGQTRRFVVPVLDLPGLTIGELGAGQTARQIESAGEITYENAPHMINPPAPRPPKPQLPQGGPEPESRPFESLNVIEMPEVDYDTTITRMREELLEALGQLGPIDAALERIEANRKEHEARPIDHIRWLESQLQRTREMLNGKEKG